MSSTTIETGLVRRLSEMSAERPVVLSLYLDLDPTEFATHPARSTAVRSLLDEARKEIESAELEQDDVKALRAALERAESFLDGELPTDGVHSVAVFACEPLELFESIALPRRLPTRIAISKTPLVGPLAVTAHEGSWGVVLVNREVGRCSRATARTCKRSMTYAAAFTVSISRVAGHRRATSGRSTTRWKTTCAT